jgi:hypothetical protein
MYLQNPETLFQLNELVKVFSLIHFFFMINGFNELFSPSSVSFKLHKKHFINIQCLLFLFKHLKVLSPTSKNLYHEIISFLLLYLFYMVFYFSEVLVEL